MDLAHRHNRRIVLAQRPRGIPNPEDFSMEHSGLPEVGGGEILLETMYISLDPYVRGRMGTESSYAVPIPIGGVVVGRTISRVVESKNHNYQVGDVVLATGGWQEFSVSDGRDVRKLTQLGVRPTLALGVLGSSGFAAYIGLIEVAQLKAGETVAVASATGPVGSVVVQLAKLHGAKVIAITGGPTKAAYARDVLRADEALDYRQPDFGERLRTATPGGIDVYFENVGGDILFEILENLKPRARIAACGTIAWYNLGSEASSPDRSPILMRTIVRKRLKVEGFLVTDWEDRRTQFESRMQEWVDDGRVAFREEFVPGLENAPCAFAGLFRGETMGKLIVKIS